MRIIDKNYDFYDYLQDYTDDTLVFDRRNSFLLDKKQICDTISFNFSKSKIEYSHMLLQCGATFWVFLLSATKFSKDLFSYYHLNNYDIELLTTWKNYNKPNKLIDVRLVDIEFPYLHRDYKNDTSTLNRSKINPKQIQQCIDSYSNNDRFTDLGTKKSSVLKKNGRWETNVRDIPLLYACGISDIVNPLDVFCGIEEYFSREKTASEKTEPLGATNNDKIIMHGFDTKVSFRGTVK